jgi:hypothetical protein
MRGKSLTKILLAGIVAMASVTPSLAMHMKHATRAPNACAKTQLRCIADCDKSHWCHVYACSDNKTILLPFTCGEDSGLCFAPRC